jgi:hypothetical protein
MGVSVNQEQMQAILRQLKRQRRNGTSFNCTGGISARQGNLDDALQEYAELVRSYREKRQVDNALVFCRDGTP